VSIMRLLPAVMLASAVGVGAQQRGEMPEPPREMSPAEIQRIFDGYLLVQVQDALNLSDQQFAQLVPRLRTLQETRRRHQVERSRLLMDLQRLTRPNARGEQADEAAIKERLLRLQENDGRLADELRKAYTAVDEVLDVRQQGRFRIFEEQIERKKLDLLLRARQNPNRMAPRRQPPSH
jgi:hypothetical protein